jgi:hypothetical protein
MTRGDAHSFTESLMAKNRKKRGLVGTAATAVTETVKNVAKGAVKAAEKYVVAPVVEKLGPTPKKVKVKKAKYKRPERTPAKPKATPATEKKGMTHAARTLRHSVAKSLPKAGAKTQAKAGPGPK